jgi:hypothetical protein
MPLDLKRLAKHPRLIHYHRLIALVLAVNAGVLWLHLERGDWHIVDGTALTAVLNLTLLNLAACVLIRQPYILNGLFGLTGRVSPSWPLRLRWMLSKVGHIGGIHAGGALAGTAWLCAFPVVAIAGGSDPTTIVLAGVLVALALVVVACAMPAVRGRTTSSRSPTGSAGGRRSRSRGRWWCTSSSRRAAIS